MATLRSVSVITTGGGDYTSLYTAEDTEDGDIVTSDEYVVFSCSGTTADTTSVYFAGWTTSVTCYVQVNGDNTSGIYNTSAYRLEYTANSTYQDVLRITGCNHFRLNNLQLKLNSIYAETYGIGDRSPDDADTDIRIMNCIIVGTSSAVRGISGDSGYTPGGNIYIWNNIIYGFDYCLFLYGNTLRNSYIYSNTLIGDAYGIYRYQTIMTAKNNYAYGGTAAYYGTITKTTCASNDATGSVGLQNIAYSTANFVNVTSGSENLHLVSGSALIDVGTDTSGEAAPLNFTDDIDGQTRSGTWDIGADEYVAAGITVSPNTIILYGTLLDITIDRLFFPDTVVLESFLLDALHSVGIFSEVSTILSDELSIQIQGTANINSELNILQALPLSPNISGGALVASILNSLLSDVQSPTISITSGVTISPDILLLLSETQNVTIFGNANVLLTSQEIVSTILSAIYSGNALVQVNNQDILTSILEGTYSGNCNSISDILGIDTSILSTSQIGNANIAGELVIITSSVLAPVFGYDNIVSVGIQTIDSALLSIIQKVGTFPAIINITSEVNGTIISGNAIVLINTSQSIISALRLPRINGQAISGLKNLMLTGVGQ